MNLNLNLKQSVSDSESARDAKVLEGDRVSLWGLGGGGVELIPGGCFF